ncbi:TBC1 domain family member 15-like [Daphnia pulex]|uniref:TBC1 domain family member 15-like n=1 Tax=Daphnia pulex TaxID=6669 RepID=UPI001EDD20B1|nr:TBC1 domain family member 15-like [Daphnia pulex]XP_046640665.1 TBC1 domain family member 15-like [Daphnia pulicaria]
MDNSEAGGSFLLYEQDGVLLTTKGISGDNSNLHLGKLRIVKEKTGIYMLWLSEENSAGLPYSGSTDTDWTVINPNQGSVGYHSNGTGRPIRFEVEDLKCICLSPISDSSGQPRRHTSGAKADPGRTCSVTFVQTDGTTYSNLIFPGGSTHGLLDALTQHLVLKRSCHDDSMILCEPKTPKLRRDPYERSLAELRLFPDRNPAMHSAGYARLGQLGQIGVGAWRFVNDLKRDPYTATMTAFSKISDYLLHEEVKANEDIAELLQKSLTLDEPTTTAQRVPIASSNDADESTMLVGSSDSSVEGYEVIQPPVADLIPRPRVNRGQPLTEIEWQTYFDEEGRIEKSQEIRIKIFRGGIEPSIRSEVWKFLLGYYPWHTSQVERKELRDKKVEEYFRMKLQWRSLSALQESRFASFKQRKDLIEKDVNRTDRTISYYAGENNTNVSTLRDVLMTYCLYDFDLGYVQGMSDLLAPLLFVLDDEVDAFWCFSAYMERVSLNFHLDQAGIKRQLSQLRMLVQAVDPHLASYLDTRDSGNLFFCFRWLLVLFKREFNYPQILRLWEVFWTDGPFHGDEESLSATNFHLLVALSILDSQRNTILENRFGFTEILKHVNDLALYIDLEEALAKAEGIFIQLKDSPSVGSEVRRILGLREMSESSEDSPSSNSTDSLLEERYETALGLHYL